MQGTIDLSDDLLGVFIQRIEYIIVFTLGRLFGEIFFHGFVFVVNIGIYSAYLFILLFSHR